jgi:hypothetical protein
MGLCDSLSLIRWVLNLFSGCLSLAACTERYIMQPASCILNHCGLFWLVCCLGADVGKEKFGPPRKRHSSGFESIDLTVMILLKHPASTSALVTASFKPEGSQTLMGLTVTMVLQVLWCRLAGLLLCQWANYYFDTERHLIPHWQMAARIIHLVKILDTAGHSAAICCSILYSLFCGEFAFLLSRTGSHGSLSEQSRDLRLSVQIEAGRTSA